MDMRTNEAVPHASLNHHHQHQHQDGAGALTDLHERRFAARLYHLLSYLSDEDMPRYVVTALCLVGANEGRTVQEYAEEAQVSKQVMSKWLIDLSDGERKDATPRHMIEWQVQSDRRRAAYFLTAKGHKALEHIQAILAGKEDKKLKLLPPHRD